MSPTSDQAFYTLKQILKAKNISYKDLGEILNLSEAGVKKMFQANDCSVSRMATICEKIGISISDLFESSQQHAVKEVELSKRQSDFFCANPNYFNFYQKLASEKKSPFEISKDYQLTEKSVRKYLSKLEEFGLIEVHAYDKIKFTSPKLARIRINNVKLSSLRSEAIKKFIENIPVEAGGYNLGTIHFKFKPTTLKRFQLDLLDLLEKYYQRSEVEQSTIRKGDLALLNVAIAQGQHSLTGEVKNIV